MHFLRQDERHSPRRLAKPKALVTVRLKSKDELEIVTEGGAAGIGFSRLDTMWVKLPARIRVVGPDGKVVKPSKKKAFYVTLETIDPMHAVTEALEEEMNW